MIYGWRGWDWMKGLSLILVALMILSPNMVGVEAQPGSGFNTAMEITPGVYSYYIGRGKSHYYKVNVSSGEVLTITMDVPPRTSTYTSTTPIRMR